MDSLSALWTTEAKKHGINSWVDEALGTNPKLPLDADFGSEQMAAEFADSIPAYRHAHTIKEETPIRAAVRDLIENPEQPLVFRDYIRNYAKTFDCEAPKDPWAHDFVPTGDGYDEYRWRRYKQDLAEYCGRHLTKMLECEHGGAKSVDPSLDWTYLGGQSTIKGMMGPCSQWPGHIGYCWEGTFHHPCNVPNPMPYKHILERNNTA